MELSLIISLGPVVSLLTVGMTEDLREIVCEFCVHSRSSCLSSDLRSTVLCVCCSLGSACEAEVKVGAQLRFCVGEESTL